MGTIDLKDAGVFVDQLSADMRAKAIVGLRRAAARGLQTIQTVLIPSRNPQPVDRGIYRAGWKIKAIPDGAELYNDSPAAALIEGGVRAANIKIGRKMLTALAEWVIRKRLVKVRTSKKTKFTYMQGDGPFSRAVLLQRGKKHKRGITSETWAEAMSMAWAIAKKAKAGKGFHNQRAGGGLQIMKQLRQDFLPGYIETEVKRQLGR